MSPMPSVFPAPTISRRSSRCALAGSRALRRSYGQYSTDSRPDGLPRTREQASQLLQSSAKIIGCEIDQSSRREQHAIGVPDLAGRDGAFVDKALADDRKVRAVIGCHVGLLHPYTCAILDHGEATHRGATCWHERFRVVQ